MKIKASTSRREFIKKTFFTTGAWAFPSIVSAETLGLNKRLSPSEKLNIGVIGLGKMGQEDLSAVLKSPQVRVTSLCDVESKRLGWAADKVKKQYNDSDIKLFSDFRKLLSQPDLDGVIISTPDHWHAIMAIEAIKAGKAVYLQSPLALTHSEGQAIVTIARRYNAVVQIGNQQRSEESFHTVCEAIRNSRLGSLQNIKIFLPDKPLYQADYSSEPVPSALDWESWLGPAPLRPYHSKLCPVSEFETDLAFSNWGSTREMGFGTLQDLASCHADIVQWVVNMDNYGPVQILPPPSEGKGKGLTYVYPNGMRVECGDLDFFSFNKNLPKGANPEILFECESGWIMCGRGGFLLSSDSKVLEKSPAPDDIRVYRSRDHYQNWVDAIRGGYSPISSVDAAHRSCTFAWLGSICLELNRSLKWNLSGEQFVNDPEANSQLRRPLRSPWRLA